MTDREILESLIKASLNTPYCWGGQSLTYGVDCSGFVINLLQAVGDFPHGQDTTAAGIYDYLLKEKDAMCVAVAQFGDIVFYGRDRITHVGFCVNDRIMVEAGGGHSRCKTPADARKYNACVRFRPIHYRSDSKGILRFE